MSNHRYVLRREWGFKKSPVVNFIMLNPSTADDVFDDPTIRRCIGFAKRWGFNGLVVTNLFAFRATDPFELKMFAGGNPGMAIGLENAAHLEREAAGADRIVCAWGDNGGEISWNRDLNVISSLRQYDLWCIRRTKKGNPAHPVREPYTDTPELFYSKVINAVEAVAG